MSDRIVLTGLHVHGRHGVYPEEREHGQDFFIDAVLELDMSAAIRSDDVTETVHYGLLANKIATIVSGEPVNLLETLAERIAQQCLDYPVVWAAEITVHKPNAPVDHPIADIAVTVRRERTPRTYPKFRRVGAPNLIAVPDESDEEAA